MSDETTPIADILKPSTKTTPAEQSPPETKTTSEAKADGTGRLHGEGGKFVPKTPKVEQTAIVQPSGEPSEPVTPPVTAPSQPPHGYVPIAALVDTRLDARQAKQERDDLRRQIAELQKHKAEPVDFFADPEAALRQHVEPIQAQFQQFASNLTFRASKAEAIASYGKQAVSDMEKAIDAAMQAGDPELNALRAHMLQSDDPVGVAMSWHKRRTVLNEVGNDPAAYKERLKAEILAELQATNGGEQQINGAAQPAPVMPSNLVSARNVGTRAGPVWAGPKPLADIFARPARH